MREVHHILPDLFFNNISTELLAALKKVGETADRALMIVDTPYDIEASQHAGVSILAFRSGGWSDEDFAGTTAICEGAEELFTELTRAPNSSALQPGPSAW